MCFINSPDQHVGCQFTLNINVFITAYAIVRITRKAYTSLLK